MLFHYIHKSDILIGPTLLSYCGYVEFSISLSTSSILSEVLLWHVAMLYIQHVNLQPLSILQFEDSLKFYKCDCTSERWKMPSNFFICQWDTAWLGMHLYKVVLIDERVPIAHCATTLRSCILLDGKCACVLRASS